MKSWTFLSARIDKRRQDCRSSGGTYQYIYHASYMHLIAPVGLGLELKLEFDNDPSEEQKHSAS